jgi:CDGSH-type Zn-finger protein/truncated hemoglobin YjbI
MSTDTTDTTKVTKVTDLLAHATALAARADLDTAARLERTVLRPLRTLLLTDPPPASLPDGPFDAALSALAADLTARCAADPRPALLEACAGVQRLVADSPGEGIPDRSAELAAAAPTRITVREDGPYLVTGRPAMTSWLGEPISPPPVAALCRCGRSGSRPWCDGTHADIGFTGAKRPDRVPDRLDSYPARQFEIRDNRGLCAHSGRCTDALPVAFRVGAEPFVAPAGARADDLLRAIQACPSGALGAAVAGRAAGELVDTDREPAIEVSLDGPYRVTGSVPLCDETGADVDRPAGASTEHYSLCRCGQSANKPFCSGAHWYADFHDPVPDPGEEPTLFAWAGGFPALLRMTRLFYERHVAEDELLAPLFARMEPDHPERVAAWLSEVFGGPELYSQRYGGYSRMISQHLGKHLSEAQRSRWVALLARSADEAGLPSDPEFRAAFAGYLEWGSRIAVENSRADARPPEGMPVPRWWWVCNATPSARVSAVAPDQPEPEPAAPPVPTTGEPVSFGRHIKGLFRARDRASMRFAFDLWSVDDVRTHAAAILSRLHDGSMPCDGTWPAERIAVFERWVDEGQPG